MIRADFMPSPVGHALAGVAVGWLVAPPEATRRRLALQVTVLAAVAAAPDLDLLVGRHSGETHSLGAAVIVGAMAAWQRWPVARTRWRAGLAVFLAWFSHPALDALASDTSLPIGVMALWPLSREYLHSGVMIFAPIYRRWWLPGFASHNLRAIAHEVLFLAPITAMVWWARRGQRAEGQVQREGRN